MHNVNQSKDCALSLFHTFEKSKFLPSSDQMCLHVQTYNSVRCFLCVCLNGYWTDWSYQKRSNFEGPYSLPRQVLCSDYLSGLCLQSSEQINPTKEKLGICNRNWSRKGQLNKLLESSSQSSLIHGDLKTIYSRDVDLQAEREQDHL